MQLCDPQVLAFSDAFTSPEDALLQEVAAYTEAHHAEPHMLSGKVQGKLLQEISRMLRPARILEIGTFTGYSALCLAEGLVETGILHTIESREPTAAIAHNFFSKSAFKHQIKLHVGKASDILPRLQETWDLVFIDADKTSYQEYVTQVLPQVRTGGYILADNIFFHGEALEENPKGKSAKAIKAFNQWINERTDIEKLVLTIRDGLYLLRKK